MTVILGLKTNNEVWIAADSLVVADNLIVDTTKSSKLLKLSNCVIGFSGNVMFRDYFDLFANQCTKQLSELLPDNPTRHNVMMTFITFWSFIREHEARMSAEDPETYSALVATPNSLYEVDFDNTVTELPRFGSVGSGGVMATGVLECLWSRSVAPEDMLKETHKIVCTYNNMCGGTQEIINVTNRNQPAVKVQKKITTKIS
jgi:ATP-dependent protease HslVU (ClpYQ) peptidase subunit